MPNPTLFALIWHDHKSDFVKVLALNLINALVNVGVIAFINRQLLGGAFSLAQLPIFLGLILLLLGTTFVSQFALTKLGHRFVFDLKTRLVKQILDTDPTTIKTVGSSKILASLSHDIQSITMAFVRLPELMQGVIICVGAGIYLASLSVSLFVAITFWLILTVWVSTVLVNKVYHHLQNLRKLNDDIYKDYETIIDGKNELTLNRHRAKTVYDGFIHKADSYRTQIIRADSFHLSAVSFSNIMVFGSIGLLFGLAQLFGVNAKIATTFALTVMFIQSPLLKAVGAYPVWQSAKIALDKIYQLTLSEHTPQFFTTKSSTWHKIRLDNVAYAYEQGFGLQAVNFTLTKGEVVFLIGANGSGKSTLAKVLTGLATPQSGQIYLDNTLINQDNLAEYQHLFSAIFSDFYLFNELLGKDGQVVDDKLLNEWLDILNIKSKLNIDNYRLDTTELSAGQKKRIALLISILEQKPILLLDEWAADQDPHYRKFFYETLIPKLKAMGKTLFVISHDDGYFEGADRLFEMRNGTLKELTGDDRKKASENAIRHLNND